MIPILYESDEKQFTTNGIGRLAEAISCVVTEERNGKYELSMAYPVKGRYFSDLTVQRIILAKPADTGKTQPFRIYEISKPLNGRVQISAQHISYDLTGIPVAPFTATGIVNALNGIISAAMVNNDYTVWTDISNTSTQYSCDRVRSFRACLGGEKGSVLDAFRQVEYEFDRFQIKAHQHRGSDQGVSIRYGKNLTDIMHTTSIASTYTGVLAQWIDSESGVTVAGDVQYTASHSSAPVEKIFIYDATQEYEEAPSVETLNNRALRYLANNLLSDPNINISISFIPLWQTEEYKNIASLERVGMGDTVHIYFTDYEINATAKVVKTVYDVLKERYNTIELGETKTSLSKALKQNSELNNAVDSLTSSIRSTNATMARNNNALTEAIESTADALQTAIDDLGSQSANALSQAQQELLESIAESQRNVLATMAEAIAQASELISGGAGGHVYIATNASGHPTEIFIMDTEDPGTAVNVLRLNVNGIGGSTNGVNGPFNVAMTLDGHVNASVINSGELNGNLLRAASVFTSALQVSAQNAIDGVNENFLFSDDGLHITRTGATYQSLFSDAGMRVMTASGIATLIAEEDTVTANNFTANNYLRIMGEDATARFQTYHDSVDNEDMFGCYWEEIS